jgi:hypothetical protein
MRNCVYSLQLIDDDAQRIGKSEVAHAACAFAADKALFAALDADALIFNACAECRLHFSMCECEDVD